MASATTLHRAPPLPARLQAGLVALLLVVAGGAWALTGDRMSGMDAGPGTELGGLGWFIVVWATMMAAMMLPAVVPITLAHARIGQGGRDGASAPAIGASALFVAGYLVSWAAAGLVAYAVVEGVRALDLGFLAWDNAGRYVAGGTILGAALYQLTVPKDACLRHCRTPALLVEHWHRGGRGALRMGLEHGAACIGCCWALMAALFALGVMSVAWMAFVAALIAAEKLVPWDRLATWGTAAILLALAVFLVAAPHALPGLTIPGGSMNSGMMGG